MQIGLLNLEIDNFVVIVFTCSVLACLGLMLLFSSVNDIQQEAFADIDQMGCGELKEFIAGKGWYDYSARQGTIESHAMHTYTWTCEK